MPMPEGLFLKPDSSLFLWNSNSKHIRDALKWKFWAETEYSGCDWPKTENK